MVGNKQYLTANDVMGIMECSKSVAYNIIRMLNEELKEKGFIVISGKVNAKYFNERTYGGAKS